LPARFIRPVPWCQEWRKNADRLAKRAISGAVTLPLEPDRGAVQVVVVGAFDLHGRDLADAQRTAAGDIDRAVDVGRVGAAASLGDARADFVDDHLLPRADLPLQAPRGDRLLALHETMPALLLDLVGDRRREVV